MPPRLLPELLCLLALLPAPLMTQVVLLTVTALQLVAALLAASASVDRIHAADAVRKVTTHRPAETRAKAAELLQQTCTLQTAM